MSVKLVRYFKNLNGVILEITEESNYTFCVHNKGEIIISVDMSLTRGQFTWIAWNDNWEDKELEVYSNGEKIKNYKIIGLRSLQIKILENYDINLLNYP